MVSEAEKPKIKPGTQFLVKALFWFADTHLLFVSSCGGERESELSSPSFKDTDSMGSILVTSSNPNYLPEAAPLKTITLGS